jgi:hypothetical protein
MSSSPDNWPIAAEGRRQIAWRRLLEAAIRHGEEILAEEESRQDESRSALAGNERLRMNEEAPENHVSNSQPS